MKEGTVSATRGWRKWPVSGLAGLAACAVVLAACGGGDDDEFFIAPRVEYKMLGAPAYDPETGTALDTSSLPNINLAFFYADSGIIITAVDGDKVMIAPRYWATNGKVFALGPEPALWDREKYLTFDKYHYDSVVLLPGQHTIVAIHWERSKKDVINGGAGMSLPFKLTFVAKPFAYYRLWAKFNDSGDSKGFWPIIVSGTCSMLLMDTYMNTGNGYWKSPSCFTNGVIVGSLNPQHIGKTYNEVFGKP